jgi:preprotein translocase subunit SecD
MMFFARWKVWTIVMACLAGVILTLPNLVSRADMDGLPDWVPHRQINLGLDLRGGSYLLLEVDLATVVRERIENMTDSARTALRQANVAFSAIEPRERALIVRLRDAAQTEEARRALRDLVTLSGNALSGTQTADFEMSATPDGVVTLTVTEAGLREKATQAIAQSIEIIRRRIDETGVNEPQIARQGADRILVQLPGVDDPDRIKRLLGTTAKMTFRLLDPASGDPAVTRAPPGAEILQSDRERDGAQPRRYVVRRRVEVEGANLTNARASFNNQTGEWVVNFEFDSVGSRRFAAVTQQNVGRPFAIVLDDKVLSAPVIREPITGGRGQISGSFNAASANDLAVLLRAGALPAPLKIIEERTVGPDLGADSIRAGVLACAVGFSLVIAYMIVAYGLFGLFACVAVVFNLFLTLGALSLMEATLTLPGIAGLLLTVGMSVDANVLINERIREEVKRGRTPIAAMEAGFSRAFSTIVDANLTSLIKMLLLFILGSGPIKGFAVTISLGILTSMFTATVVVRLMMATWYRARRPKLLPV